MEHELNLDEMINSKNQLEVVVQGKFSGETLLLNWAIIRRVFDTLLLIAPADLRKPVGFMNQVYKQKLAIEEFVDLELKTEDLIIKAELERDTNTDTTIPNNEG